MVLMTSGQHKSQWCVSHVQSATCGASLVREQVLNTDKMTCWTFKKNNLQTYSACVAGKCFVHQVLPGRVIIVWSLELDVVCGLTSFIQVHDLNLFSLVCCEPAWPGGKVLSW